MQIIRRGPTKTFWGLIFLVALAVYLTTFQVVRVENWQVRTVIQAEWPSPDPSDKGSALRGPHAFAIDAKGNLIVADTSAGGFVTYLPDGTQKSVLKVNGQDALPTRIEVDSQGFIYGITSDRKQVVRYGPDGSVISVYSQPVADVYFVEGIGVFGSGTLYVQDIGFDKDSYTRRLSRVSPGGQAIAALSSVEKSAAGDSRPAEGVQITAEVDDFVVGRDGTLCVAEATQDPNTRTVTRVTPSGKTMRFTIRQQEAIRNCRLLGLDADGNLYTAMALGKNLLATVERYNPSGQRLSAVALKGISGANVAGRVDQSGSFYVTRTSDTGYYIDKYVVRLETRVVSRFSR